MQLPPGGNLHNQKGLNRRIKTIKYPYRFSGMFGNDSFFAFMLEAFNHILNPTLKVSYIKNKANWFIDVSNAWI